MTSMEERWAAIEPDRAAEPLTGVMAHLVVGDAAAAIDFYVKAFGAEETLRLLADDGKRIMHTRLRINGSWVMLNDDFPEMRGGGALPAPAGIVLHLPVDDTDKWFDRAIAAGATPRMPPADMFWGDRYAQLADPFGHVWSLGTPVPKG